LNYLLLSAILNSVTVCCADTGFHPWCNQLAGWGSLQTLVSTVGTCGQPQLYGCHLQHHADNTAVIATDNHPAITSSRLQTNLLAIQGWLAKWRMKANGSKSTHITFTMRRGTCSHQQCPTPSNRSQVSRAAPRQKTHLI
jgi:hypothetical protein